jgi:DNA-binding NtrC family response regulator
VGSTILIVESDPDTRDRLGAALRSAHHDVIVAATMSEAFMRLGEGGIDIVVVDSFDPRVGVVDLVKNMDTLPDTPPVVLVSGSPFAPEISARIGAAAFLPKPLDLSEVASVIGRLLGHLRPVRSFDDEPTGPARQFGT